MKTNRERATSIVLGGSLESARVIERVTQALDRADERGCMDRYELEVKLQLLEDIRRHDMQELGKAYDEIEQLKESNEFHRQACPCCNPQPEPQRYTREEAVALIDAMKDAFYSVWVTFSQSSIDKALEARHSLIDAITGQPKPAPQFDAERVSRLLDILDGNIDGAKENEDDCGDLFLWSAKTCVSNLRKALGIE